jgi:hypothetical protein
VTHRIVTLDRKKAPGPQVWEHDRRASELGLGLVVELHAKKDQVSRAIGELWRSKDALVDETLDGIYLLRADLLAIGPKAALGLTPYALFGAPLFVGWNPLGQVLTRAAFASGSRDDVVTTLSAFFQDVAQGRKHALHPAPRIGGRPRRARSPAPQAREQAIDTKGEAIAEDVILPEADATPPNAPSAVAQLDTSLDAFLANALELARSFLRQHDLRDDYSLHSLRQLDALFDEQANEAEPPEPEGRFLAAMGVYLGAVVTMNASAEWFVDRSKSSPIEALSLRVNTAGKEQVFHPVAIALDRLRDAEKGLYGHAVAMCRKL